MSRILIIEDTESILDDIKLILSLESYDVLEARDGQQGLDIAFKHLPDLIICDIMMPILDGYGVLNNLRLNHATASIPFIFLTAKSSKEDLRKGMISGADDYITKPFTSEELVEAVKTRLDKYKLIKRNELLKNNFITSKIEHFKNQLKVHDLDIIVNLESKYKNLLEVLYKIITYPVHEGEKPFLGVFFKKEKVVYENAKIKIFSDDDLELAYKLSGADQSFVLYNENEFKGLIIFDQEMLDEKIILDMLAPDQSILITSYKGINKVYFNNNVFTTNGIKWEHKRPLSFYVAKIHKHFPDIDNTIINIMNFAFYTLSPNNIGATIVYSFDNIIRKGKINALGRKAFNINDKGDISPLKNIIYKTDGAVFFDKDGYFIKHSIHLNSSKKSKKEILPNLSRGTRHSSSQRYSYDHRNCLVVTVSQDGPVTIYSKGINICHME